MDTWNIYRWTKSDNDGVYSHGKKEGIWELSGKVECDYIQITQTDQVAGLMGDFQGSHICKIYPGYGDLGREKAEKIARIIAAAPKMLRVLKDIEPYLHDLEADNFSDNNAGIFRDEKLTKIYMALKSCIAHATNNDHDKVI
jgi:hypothetical protein